MFIPKNAVQTIFGEISNQSQVVEVKQEEKMLVPKVDEHPSKSPVLHKMKILPKGPISASSIGKDLLREYHFAIGPINDLHVWCPMGYRLLEKKAMGSMVRQYLESMGSEDRWASHLVREVMEYLRTDVPSLEEIPPMEKVHVINGILDLTTKEHSHPNPNYLSTIKIPVFYDPNATCPEIDEFIKSIFPEDAIELGYELAADLLTPDRSIQKAILLYGTGGNGKTTFLNLLSRLIGSCNISNISLHALGFDRFASSGLYGMLANICADLSSKTLPDNAIFKAITGGDRINAQRKFGQPFEFTPFVRLIFGTNYLPKSTDMTEAFYDRWLVVPFTQKFRGTKEEVDSYKLLHKLTQPAELSGLLNRAIEVWPKLREDGFTESLTMKEALGSFKAENDPVGQWADEALIEDPESWTLGKEIRLAYNQIAKEKGNPTLSAETFGKRFKGVRPKFEKRQNTINGKSRWGYRGVRLKSGDS